MWYRKNVGIKERSARIIAGLLMMLWGLVGMHASLLGLLVAGSGLIMILTGSIGYCPACAVAGRKPLVDNE
ncbi:MAG: DUF2892 domain-containing protein [Tahibacter sp.]